MSLLHSVSSLLSVTRLKLAPSRNIHSQIINAIKSLPTDKSRWSSIAIQRYALLDICASVRCPDISSNLFWESVLEEVRICIAKHYTVIVELHDDEADAFMCILQALLDFIPRRSVYRPSILRTLMSLSIKSNCIPTTVLLSDATRRLSQEEHSWTSTSLKRASWKGKIIAIRIPQCHQLTNTNQEKVFNRIRREILLWRQLHHPNLLEVYGIYYDPFSDYRRPTLATPWLDHGSVLEYVKENPSAPKLKLLRQVVRALTYLHKHDPPIVHKGICCSNIYVNNSGEAILGEFGLSRIDDSSFQNPWIALRGGNSRWQAPETLFPPVDTDETLNGSHKSDRSSPHASRKTDIWAIGMTILELYSECQPFSSVAHDAAAMVDLYHGGNPRRPERQELLGLDSELMLFEHIWRVIKRCWLRDPKSRPTAASLYRDLDPNRLSMDKPLPLPPPLEDRVPSSPIVTDSGYREGAEPITNDVDCMDSEDWFRRQNPSATSASSLSSRPPTPLNLSPAPVLSEIHDFTPTSSQLNFNPDGLASSETSSFSSRRKSYQRPMQRLHTYSSADEYDSSLHSRSFRGNFKDDSSEDITELRRSSMEMRSSSYLDSIVFEKVPPLPSVTSLPFKTISWMCNIQMFGSNPDVIRAIENKHGVELLLAEQCTRNSEDPSKRQYNVYVSARTDMPDLLSAQWEIEKIIEFYQLFEYLL